MLLRANWGRGLFQQLVAGRRALRRRSNKVVTPRSRIEVLTDRAMLTATLSASLIEGELTITDTDAAGINDALSIGVSGSDLVISSLTASFIAAPSGGSLSKSDQTLTIPLASVSSALVINGGAGNDTVTFDSDITFPTNVSLNVDLQDDVQVPGTDSITLNADVNLSLSGTGAATFGVSKTIQFNSGSSLQSVNGDVILAANHQEVATTGEFAGIRLDGSTISVTGTGILSLTGFGGNAGRGTFGVELRNASVVSGGTTGEVTVYGQGGATSDTDAQGIFIRDSLITSLGGNVVLAGYGGNSGSGTAVGVLGLRNSGTSTVTAGGSGTVNVTGTGGNGSGNVNAGVAVPGGTITSNGGDVTVFGYGAGNANGQSNFGVAVIGGTIAGVGNAKTTIAGIGGLGSSAHGIDFNFNGAFGTSPATISTVNGDMDVTGQAGSGEGSIGINLWKAGTISSLGTGDVKLLTNSLRIDTSETPGTIDVGENTLDVLPILEGTPFDLTTEELARITAGTLNIDNDDGNGGGSTPSVELTVSATSGSEASETVITLTATASSTVASQQTVDLVVTGTGITGSDYSLSKSTITIAQGETTGTATFTIQDDDSVEGPETAKISLSNPSSGLVLGATTSRHVVIVDNDTTTTEVDLPADGTGDIVIELDGNDLVVKQGGNEVLRTPQASAGQLVINGTAANDDTLVIDISEGNPLPSGGLVFDGGAGGNDMLIVIGNGQSATYSPDEAVDGNGVITSAAGVIIFQNLEPIDMSGFASVTVDLPGADDVITVSDGFDFATGLIAAIHVAGTSGGVGFEELAVWDTTTLIINTTLNTDGNDSITLTSADGVAANVTNLTINTGSGTDTFALDGDVTLTGNLAITTAASITQAGASTLDITGTTNINTGTANLSLNTVTNDCVGAVTLSGGEVSLFDANDLSLASVTVTKLTATAEDELELTAAVNAGAGTVTLTANFDEAGSDGFVMQAGSSITTTNDTADAVSITVNVIGLGDGDATITTISAGTTPGLTGGRVTISTNNGEIVDGNAASNNITAGNAVLSGGSVGTSADPIETVLGNLEGSAMTGDIAVRNTGDLIIGSVSAMIGLSASAGTLDVRSTGSLTIDEDVSANGDVLLQTNEAAATGDDLSLSAGATVTSATADVDLVGADNVTLLATSAVSAASGKITISGDVADNDAAGSTMNLNALLTSGTGISVLGGPDDDEINFAYVSAAHTGTVTIAGAGGSDDVFINGTTSDEEFHFTTAAPTDDTYEMVTRGSAVDEPIHLTNTVESLRINGGTGFDTFYAQPSMLFPVTINGDGPVWGDAGVPPGDDFILDSFLNDFTFDCDEILVANGSPLPYQPIRLRSIETFLLIPQSAGPDQFYDFNGVDPQSVDGMTPTQTGFTGVLPTTLYSQGLGYGWSKPVGSYALTDASGITPNTGVDGDLINDMHAWLGSTQDRHVFNADVADGWVMVTVTFGHPVYDIDDLTIINMDTRRVIASNLDAVRGQFNHATVQVRVTDGSLNLGFQDGTSGRPNRYVVSLANLSIRPSNLLSMGFIDAPSSALNADGVTEDTYRLGSAPANSLVTITTTLATLVGTDADEDLAGFQVLTDGTGQADVTLRRPSVAGEAVIAFSMASGEQMGCLTIEYDRVNARKFDFNSTSSSPTYDQLTPSNLDGYQGVLPTDVYSSNTGYGWSKAVSKVQRPANISGPLGDLYNDGNSGTRPGTFRVDLDDGDYVVHLSMGDGVSHQSVSVVANGTTVVNRQALTRNSIFETSFPVTITNGHLDLTFSQNDGVFGNAYWVINALEIVPSGAINTVTPVDVGTIPADGTTVTTITANTTLPDGTLVTVSSTLGTIESADDDASTAGVQVTVTGGVISFDLRSPAIAGTPTIEWRTLDGLTHTSESSVTFLTFSVMSFPTTRQFDFNNGVRDGETTPTAGGFTSVRANHVTPAVDGFGWLSSPTAFDAANQTVTEAPNDLYRDGHAGVASTNRIFRVAAAGGESYDITAHLGRLFVMFDQNFLTVEGVGEVAVPATTYGDWFQEVVINGATDNGTGVGTSGDGFIDIKFEDRGGTRRTGWAVNGLIVDHSVPPLMAVRAGNASDIDAVFGAGIEL